MQPTPSPSSTGTRTLFYFMAAWILLNLVQAYFTGLDADETYYWMFSRHLDWGYFDHPPMVAVSVKFGELIAHGPVFTRLGTVLFSAGAVYFGYQAIPPDLRNIKLYILCFMSIVMLHVYGFIVTPDSSLLFFTTLFFYAYRLYLNDDKFKNVLFLAVSIAGMLYSKYQGILPVFFVFLSNPKLVFRYSAWAVVLLVTVMFLPHLWWQYQHDWPTVRYHLLERGRSSYKLEKTTNYLLGQLLIWGPFSTIPAYWFFLKQKSKGLYLRAHFFTLWGILIFFLLTSFKKNTEPQWTLTAAVSFIVLMMLMLQNASAKRNKTFRTLMIINIAVIIIARLFFLIPNPVTKSLKAFNYQANGQSIADSIYKHTASSQVVFLDSYQLPSLLKYYHPDITTSSYNTVYSRKNYFTMSGDEAPMNNQPIFFISTFSVKDRSTEIKSRHNTFYITQVDSFRALTSLKISLDTSFKKAKAGQVMNVSFMLENKGAYHINGTGLYINYTFFKTKQDYYSPNVKWQVTAPDLAPGYKKQVTQSIIFPATPGKYMMVFSFVQPGLPSLNTFASPFYNVEVE